MLLNKHCCTKAGTHCCVYGAKQDWSRATVLNRASPTLTKSYSGHMEFVVLYFMLHYLYTLYFHKVFVTVWL